jgi:hypothetical protein
LDNLNKTDWDNQLILVKKRHEVKRNSLINFLYSFYILSFKFIIQIFNHIIIK